MRRQRSRIYDPSIEEMRRIRDEILGHEILEERVNTSAQPPHSKVTSPKPVPVSRRYRPREKPFKEEPLTQLTPARATERYNPPPKSYWASDGFRYLVASLPKLSPSAWKVVCYVAYRQLRSGIVFRSEPVALSLRRLAAGTG